MESIQPSNLAERSVQMCLFQLVKLVETSAVFDSRFNQALQRWSSIEGLVFAKDQGRTRRWYELEKSAPLEVLEGRYAFSNCEYCRKSTQRVIRYGNVTDHTKSIEFDWFQNFSTPVHICNHSSKAKHECNASPHGNHQ